jgi:hypothetical protein
MRIEAFRGRKCISRRHQYPAQSSAPRTVGAHDIRLTVNASPSPRKPCTDCSLSQPCVVVPLGFWERITVQPSRFNSATWIRREAKLTRQIKHTPARERWSGVIGVGIIRRRSSSAAASTRHGGHFNSLEVVPQFEFSARRPLSARYRRDLQSSCIVHD